MTSTFSVTVLLFAAAREIAGTGTVRVSLPLGATVVALRTALAVAFPPLTALLAKCAIAVNHDFAPDDLVLSPDDEVALIPPVSGG